ncbi:hypothetical protein K1719_042130 [Acacia pycnantha]|nr:hypothetical protein K1719_042130 [Acacia pycnantha]
MTGSAPLTHNRTQTIFPSSREAIPLTSQATVSTVPPPISTRARTASSAPSASQTIPRPPRCSFCGEVLTWWHPILPCNHSFCEDCLKVGSPPLEKGNPRCAKCDVDKIVAK